MTDNKIQIPVVSAIPGIGEALRKQLSSPTASSLVSKLYQSSKLKIVDLPLPVVCPPNVRNEQQPEEVIEMATSSLAPQWKIDPTQQKILEDAEILFMDAHLAAPLLLAPKTNLPFELQHLLKKVQWVQGTYAGMESYHQYPDAPADPGFTVSRAGGIMPKAVAQFVFGYVIAIERKLFEAKQLQKKRVFVGQEIGRTFKASGFQVVGFKRRVSDEERQALLLSADRTSTVLSEVLEQSDYVVNVLPSTSATRYLLTENMLEHCRKREPVFINVGRGDVISEKTIIAALDKGLLSKAVLDVFEREPLPKESPLWLHPKVIVTPHIAGTVFPEDVADVLEKNLNRRIEGKEVLYQMDWSSGY
ncbi:unnamed protein product [Peronospora destructor]|uniref:D-isomer specific 2-hydroxyacid dehydrogenase NAD-binding domain-containing protein n=1 Tax=Peronospora destructor TaxID=86335 RepID=A0AAV0TRT5_9STRA|nr:unnamed protein product [Peronospora destructor]